jgi:hypothetical protein
MVNDIFIVMYALLLHILVYIRCFKIATLYNCGLGLWPRSLEFELHWIHNNVEDLEDHRLGLAFESSKA